MTNQDVWPDDHTTISRRIRMHMGDKLITHKALAEDAGIARATLTNKLRDSSQWTIADTVAIAKALNKSWLWVMTGKDGQ